LEPSFKRIAFSFQIQRLKKSGSYLKLHQVDMIFQNYDDSCVKWIKNFDFERYCFHQNNYD